MSDESVITIEIRAHEKAALEAAHRISTLLLASGPCWLRRTPRKYMFSSTRTSTRASGRAATSIRAPRR
ncbi:hypothetical protein [Streptomyces sp. NPDC054961]